MRIAQATSLLLLSLTIIITAPGQAWTGQPQPDGSEAVPELQATRVNPHPPQIDGFLDDAVWRSTKVHFARDFTQREPDEGHPATESTLVAITYDDQALYAAFWCYDSEPEGIQAPLVRRDRWSESDKIVLRLDPYHNHQSGYGFEVNAAGVQRDRRYYNDDWNSLSWDAVWESAVQRHPWGWSAEVKIPFHALRFEEKEEHTWGVDLIRVISRKQESVIWAFTPAGDGGIVRTFGHLTGLTGIQPSRHFEVRPYAVSSLETEPDHAGNPDGRDFLANTGFDLKYGLSSNLTLDATINPDFGQVELDAPILNLSSYETWFPERRPFFLEGANLFDTDFTLFYSRRIGRAPNRSVDDDAHEYYTDYPKGTTILGATKLTGRLAGGTSIAVLAAITEEEEARYAALTNVNTDTLLSGEIDTLSIDTVGRRAVVEPRAGYAVVRVKQEIMGNSSVGGMLTVASQETESPETTGGIDWRLRTANDVWMTRGQVIFSETGRERTGYGLRWTFEKATGRHVRGAVGTVIKSPELDINRLGFSSRNDSKHFWSWLQYRTRDDWWIVRNSWHNLNVYTSRNYDGIQYSLGGNYNAHIEFTNNWRFGGGISLQAEQYSDMETRGNGVWEWPEVPTASWWFSLTTDRRRTVSFNWNPGGGRDRGGSWWANYVGVEVRPRSNMEFEIGANYVRNNGTLRWVENVGYEDTDSSLFARLNRDQVSIRASASVVFNKNLSFQISSRGIVSGLDYDDYRFYRGGNEYGPAVDGYNHDRNWTALNSTAVLRWEYSPGSTVYLVWTRARSHSDDSLRDLDFSRDIERMFSGDADNLFLVKASYWVNI